MESGTALLEVLRGFLPMVPWLVGLAAFWVVVSCPMPGRGPGLLQRRDSWRRFRFEARRVVMTRAGNRCEGAILLAWGRCRQIAVEADHIYPWSKGGATVLGNGQALCRDHNRRKSNLSPPWWYVLCLERRRRCYFPDAEDVRVRARMSRLDREERLEWAARKRKSRAGGADEVAGVVGAES